MIMLKYPSRAIRRGFLTSREHKMSCSCILLCTPAAHLVSNVFGISPIVGGGVCRMGQEITMVVFTEPVKAHIPSLLDRGYFVRYITGDEHARSLLRDILHGNNMSAGR